MAMRRAGGRWRRPPWRERRGERPGRKAWDVGIPVGERSQRWPHDPFAPASLQSMPSHRGRRVGMEPPASRPAGNPGLDERVLVVFGSSNREFKTMKKLIVGRACLAALALSTTSGIRAEDYIYSGFDLDTEGWARGWGVGDFTLDWDASTDAKGDPASGSLKITVNTLPPPHGRSSTCRRRSGSTSPPIRRSPMT